MSQQSAFKICAQWNHPLTAKDLTVTVRRDYNRILVDGIDERCIFIPWQEKVNAMEAALAAGHPAKLFNGTKFRLHRILPAVDGDKIQLQLGITDYRSSLGCVNHIAEYQAEAEKRCLVAPHDNQHPPPPQLVSDVRPLLAQALGVEALLVTADGCAVLFRRSQYVAEMPGWYCCPGGHPEPKHVLKSSTSESMSLDEQADWFASVESAVVVRELMDSSVDEIVAELGLPVSALTNAGLVGIVEHGESFKPDLITLVRTSWTGKQVEERFNLREAEETFESDAGTCVVIPLTTTAQGLEDAIATYKITPASLACLQLGMNVLRVEGG